MRGDRGRAAMRFSIEERTSAEQVTRAEYLSNFVRSIDRGLPRFATATQDQIDGLTGVARVIDDRSLFVLRHSSAGQQSFDGAGGEEGEERMWRKRICGEAVSVRSGGVGARQHPPVSAPSRCGSDLCCRLELLILKPSKHHKDSSHGPAVSQLTGPQASLEANSAAIELFDARGFPPHQVSRGGHPNLRRGL